MNYKSSISNYLDILDSIINYTKEQKQNKNELILKLIKDNKIGFLKYGGMIAICILIGISSTIINIVSTIDILTLDLENFIMENVIIATFSILIISIMLILKKRNKIPYV